MAKQKGGVLLTLAASWGKARFEEKGHFPVGKHAWKEQRCLGLYLTPRRDCRCSWCKSVAKAISGGRG